MKLNFLCSHHRHWLQSNPSAALTTSIRSYEQGLDMAEEDSFKAAATHAGCALEAAQILMVASRDYSSKNLAQFSQSGTLLVQSLSYLGEADLAGHVHSGVVAFLEELLLQGVNREEVLFICQHWVGLGAGIGLQPYKVEPSCLH